MTNRKLCRDFSSTGSVNAGDRSVKSRWIMLVQPQTSVEIAQSSFAQADRPTPDARPHGALAAAVFFVVALGLVFALSMHKSLDIDEHAFIASGAILSRHGTLPYRDYHYNHMPTEVMVYALLFKTTGHLLLAARAFQSVCAAAAATALFVAAYGAFERYRPHRRLLLAICIGALLLSNPLFTKTAGLSWNHDFPLLMSLAAFLALRRAVRGRLAAPRSAAAGALLAIAVTTRLTFAPALAGFVLLIALYPDLILRRRVALVAWFAAGFLVASAPALWVWAQSPRNAFFGNFLYPRLNTWIHELHGEHRPFTTFPILRYYLKSLVEMPGNGVVTIGFLILTASTLRLRRVMRRSVDCEILAILVIAALLIASGFMPAPPYIQYFYAATPFMILGIALCLGSIEKLEHDRGLWRPMAGGLALSLAFGLPLYWVIVYLPTPHNWVPLRVHATGMEVRQYLKSGTVFTLEPIYPLEAGLDIDPRFVTNRFELRVADFLTPQKRSQYLMPAPADLPEVFDQTKPAGMLIVMGADGILERQMIRTAEERGYRRIILTSPGSHQHRQTMLWLRPKPSGESPP